MVIGVIPIDGNGIRGKIVDISREYSDTDFINDALDEISVRAHVTDAS